MGFKDKIAGFTAKAKAKVEDQAIKAKNMVEEKMEATASKAKEKLGEKEDDDALNIIKYENSVNHVSDIPKSKIAEFSNNYFSMMATGGTQFSANKIYFGQSIPNNKLKKAQSTYADYSMDEENALILFDNTTMGSATEGFTVTENAFYFNLKNESKKLQKGKFFLSEINKLHFPKNSLANFLVAINGERLHLSGFFNKKTAYVLQSFFNKLFENDLEISKDEAKKFLESQINPKILQRIREYMIEGETLTFIAWGLDSLTARDFVVCTTKRIIIINRGMFGLQENIRDFEYDIITSIGVKKEGLGLMDTALKQCKLEIHAAGSVFNIDTLQRSEAEQIIKIARKQKQEMQIPQQPIQQVIEKTDITGEIKKLKELLDAGALDQEEFDTAKKTLLSKM